MNPTVKHSMSTDWSLADFVQIVKRRWRFSAGFIAATMLLTIAALWIMPHRYRSESKLFLRLGRETATLDPAAQIGRPANPVPLPLERESEINSVTEMLQSRVILERVVDAIGPKEILNSDGSSEAADSKKGSPIAPKMGAFSPTRAALRSWMHIASIVMNASWRNTLSDRDRAIIKLRKMIEIKPVKKSDVLSVSCECRSPQLAQKIVATLVDVYLAEHVRANRTPGANDFLEHETNQAHEALARAEDKLRGLKEERGMASPDSQRELVVARAARLEDELMTTTADLASAEVAVKTLRDKITSMPATVVTGRTNGMPNHDVELMRNEYYRLQMMEQELRSKYTDEHVLVKQIKERTAAAKKVLDEEAESHEQVTSGPNVVYDQTQLELVKQEPLLSALRAKAEALRSQLEQVRQDVKQINTDELLIKRQERELKLLEANYQAYAQHLEQNRIDRALEKGRISNINVVQPATFEPRPVGPRSLLIACLGLMLGSMGAIGLPIFSESMKKPAKASRGSETQLGVPMLASIPRFGSEQLSTEDTSGQMLE